MTTGHHPNHRGRTDGHVLVTSFTPCLPEATR